YFETFAAGDDNLAWAIEMEADRMVNSFVSKQHLDSEMSVVRNEFELGENNPGSVLFQRMQKAAYPWHNYGNPIIGMRSDIERVPIDRLQAFYRTWYQPDNAVLIVAGRIDEARAVELVARHFGALPRPSRPLPALDKSASLDRARDALTQAVESLRKDRITAEEVARARTALLNDFEKSQLDTGAFVRALSEFSAMGDWRLFFLYRERLRKLGLED